MSSTHAEAAPDSDGPDAFLPTTLYAVGIALDALEQAREALRTQGRAHLGTLEEPMNAAVHQVERLRWQLTDLLTVDTAIMDATGKRPQISEWAREREQIRTERDPVPLLEINVQSQAADR